MRDRELAALRNKNYDLIGSVETPDPRTLTINWSRPYQVTVPWDERMQVAGQILNHITSQLVVLPLFYDMEVSLISDRLQNATPLTQGGTSQVWNGQEWDVT